LVQHQSLSKAEFQSLAEEVQREQLTQVEPPTRNENHVKSKHNEQLHEAMAEFNRSVNFRVDQDTGITVLTVRDRATQEVIRQIPPDEFLTLVSRLDEMRGIFFEEMA
jgi:flagellar protein FlaG